MSQWRTVKGHIISALESGTNILTTARTFAGSAFIFQSQSTASGSGITRINIFRLAEYDESIPYTIEIPGPFCYAVTSPVCVNRDSRCQSFLSKFFIVGFCYELNTISNPIQDIAEDLAESTVKDVVNYLDENYSRDFIIESVEFNQNMTNPDSCIFVIGIETDIEWSTL